MAEIDNLSIRLTADATSAINSIGNLNTKLGDLSKTLSGLNSSSVKGFSSSMNELSTAMNSLKNVKMTQFNRVVNGIKKFEELDNSQISSVANTIRPLASAIGTLNGVTFNGSSITSLINALTRLSNADVGSLNSLNFSKLGNSIAVLSSNLSGASNVSRNTIQLTNAIAKLGASGGTIGLVEKELPSLGTALKSFASSMSNASAVSSELISFTSAIGTLASAGARTATTADNLGKLAVALKEFFTTMSSAPTVNSSIVQMTQALGNLASQGSKVGSASNSIVTGLSSFSTSSTKATKSAFSLASAIGKFYATYWLVIRAIKTLGSAVNYASDLTEVQNVVDTAFGDMNYKVEEFAQNSIQQFGMSELAVKQYSSRFQAMGTAMGISTQAVSGANDYLSEATDGYIEAGGSMADMSLNLTKLTADMASFYDVEQDAVAEDLAAIFTGQTRPLRTYGLDLSQATLQEWAMKNGLDADISSMSQAQKTMLRYQYVLANTTNAQGDFAKTSNTWANQVRILKMQFQQLGTVIGTGLISAFKPFLQGLNSILAEVTQFATNVLNALGKIFGWTFEISGGGTTTDDLADSVDDVADATDDASDGADDLTDGLTSATTAAKKLKSTVLGIDELNIISPDDDDDDTSTSGSDPGSGSSGSGSGTSSGTGSDITATATKGESLLSYYTSDIDSLYELGEYIGNALTNAMNSIDWDSVYEKARGFGTGLANFLNGLISPELFGALGRTIAGALNTALYFLNSFGTTFDWADFGLSIATGINEFFRTFDFANMAKTLNVWVQGIFTAITTALTNVDWVDVYDGIKTFLENLDLKTVAIIIGALSIKKIVEAKIAQKALSLIGTSLSKQVAKSMAEKLGVEIAENATISTAIKDGLIKNIQNNAATYAGVGVTIAGVVTAGFAFVDMWQNGFDWGNEIVLGLGVGMAAIGLVMAGAVTAGFAAVGAAVILGIATAVILIKDNWEQIGEAFDGLNDILNNVFGDAMNSLFDFITLIGITISNFLDGIPTFFSNTWSNIKGVLSGVKDWFGNMFQGAYDKVTGIFSGIPDWFSGKWGNIKDNLSDVVSWFSDKFTKAYDKVKSAFTNIGTWFSDKWKKVREVFTNATTGVTVFFSDKFSKGYSKVQDAFKDIKTWFSGKWGNVMDIFTDKKNGVVTFFSDKFSSGYGKVTGAFDTISSDFNAIYTKIKDVFNGKYGKNGKNVETWFKDAFGKAYSAMIGVFDGVKNAFTTVCKKAFSPIKTLVNGIIKGVNWVLYKMGSKNQNTFNEWGGVNFAKGTSGLKQDTLGIVNDQKGSTYRELIVPPHGKPFIPEGRNVMLPLTKGTKIMPADQTKQLMNTPKFASGIGSFFGSAWAKISDWTGDILDYLENPKKLVQIALDKFVDTSGLGGVFTSVGKAMLNTSLDSIVDYVKGKLNDYSPSINYDPSKGVSQWSQLAKKALKRLNVYSASNLKLLLYQMKTESGGNPKAINNWDINAKRGTPSKGLMQVIDPTFKAYAIKPYNKNIWDPYSNILAATNYTLKRYGSLANGWKGHGYADGIGAIGFRDIIKGYAGGGYPDTGSLFYAGERGVAEILGTVNGKTAVAGGQEITGITNAVNQRGEVEANLLKTMINVLEEIADKDTSFQIDGREIVKSYDKQKRRNGYSFT